MHLKDISYVHRNSVNMPKQELSYTDLSSKELEELKETYIKLKVNNMTQNDLKEFATENISLQIKSTIGHSEELEAWQEMEDFFKDEYLNTIEDIQIKLRSKNSESTYPNIEEKRTVIEDEREDKKLDMWED